MLTTNLGGVLNKENSKQAPEVSVDIIMKARSRKFWLLTTSTSTSKYKLKPCVGIKKFHTNS